MRILIATITAAVLALFVSSGVMAQSAKQVVDAAKAEGIVGEQADGFVGVVEGRTADAATRAAVSEMNAGRAQLYRDAAARNNVSPEAAGASSFQARYASIPAGQWVRDANGRWSRK